VLHALTLILCCQLAGEMAVLALGLPIPGPVAGMALLFAGLLVSGRVPPDIAQVGDGLLGNLSLMFVPAGVGVMLHAPLMASEWLAISVSLVASTLATIAVTALVMRRLGRPE
jgi:holin-like protein